MGMVRSIYINFHAAPMDSGIKERRQCCKVLNKKKGARTI
jgi:hypothetical protein